MTKKPSKPSKQARTPKKVRRGKPQAWSIGVKTPIFSAKFKKMEQQISQDAVSSIPYATTTMMRPKFEVLKGDRPDSVKVRGIEPLASGLFNPTGPVEIGEVLAAISINPVSITGNRLREYALLYTKYLCKRARVMWIPRAALTNSQNAGEVMFSFERDPDLTLEVGSIVNYDDFFAREGSSSGPVFSTIQAEYKVTDLQTTYYTHAEIGDERRLTDQAIFYLIAGSEFSDFSGNGGGLGKMYVEYEYELYAPRTEGFSSGAYQLTGSPSDSTALLLFGNNYTQTSHPAIYFENLDGASELVVRAGHALWVWCQCRFDAPVTPTGATYGFYINLTITGSPSTTVYVGEPGGTTSDSSSGTLEDTGASFLLAINTVGSGDARITMNGANYGATPGPTVWNLCLSKVVAYQPSPTTVLEAGRRRYLSAMDVFKRDVRLNNMKRLLLKEDSDIELVPPHPVALLPRKPTLAPRPQN